MNCQGVVEWAQTFSPLEISVITYLLCDSTYMSVTAYICVFEHFGFHFYFISYLLSVAYPGSILM